MSAKSLPVRKAPELSLLGKQISQIQRLAPPFLGMVPVPRNRSQVQAPWSYSSRWFCQAGGQGRQGPGAAPAIFHVTQQQSQMERVGSWCHYQSSRLSYS